MVKENGNRRTLIPTQVKWENPGDKVEGRILSKEITMYQDSQRGRYLIVAADGLKVVLGSFQIDQALSLVDEGAYIGIEYLGEEGTVRGTKFKKFDIWVDDGLGAAMDTGELVVSEAA